MHVRSSANLCAHVFDRADVLNAKITPMRPRRDDCRDFQMDLKNGIGSKSHDRLEKIEHNPIKIFHRVGCFSYC